jgi:Predicted membrane protein
VTATDGSTRIRSLLPGIVLCVAIAAAAALLQVVEERVVGHAIIEAIVIAILLGTAARTIRTPPERDKAGIAFSAKQVLEFAIFLLGASVNLPELLRAGPALLGGIVLIVAVSLTLGYTMGRVFGLAPRLAVLVACGTAICGNSAIAAVAPVIGANADDVASSSAFTAGMGVVMVLGLPLLIGPLALSNYQYGVVAGMSVYAVPQVLAATFPVSQLSVEVGTLVKLVRVLMLGPVVLFLSLVSRRIARRAGAAPRLAIGKLVPWFIVGFIALAVLRSVGLIPAPVAAPVREISRLLTVVAMAALGLGVDLRSVARAGSRVSLTVVTSLAALLLMSIAMIALLGIR